MKPFYFAEGQPKETSNSNKENEIARADDRQHSPSKQASQQLPSSPSKLPPSTPATRLPLADLLGENEDFRFNLSKPVASPQEQLGWQANRSPQSSNPKGSARGHKRACSSSPPTASQRSAMKKAKQKAALDLEELKKSLRTPETDPANELWNKYNIGTGKGTPFGQHMAALAAGTTSSSPYAHDEQTGNVSGLRRWTSCGMEFPNSKRKRRKIDHQNTSHLAEVFEGESVAERISPPDRAKTSRINTLLDKISESLDRSRQAAAEEHAPSSSSPLPDRPEDFDRDSISPVRAPELASRSKSEHSPTEREAAPPGNETLIEGASGDQSDYGSDEFTTETVHETAAIPDPHQHRTSPRIEMADVDEDEFGDDFDFSADDLDDLDMACSKRTLDAKPVNADTMASPPLKAAEKPSQSRRVDNDDDDDDDIDIDEELFAAAEATAMQSHSTAGRTKSSAKRRIRTIQRYLIKDVIETEYTADGGRRQMQKVLSVQDEKSSSLKAVTLRDSWFDTRCTGGSYVHIIGSFDRKGHCIISDAENMLILHPDHLISALAVADSFSCMRKAVLQDRIKATSESTPPMLYGTILHEIFQEAMKANRWDEDWLNETIVTLVERHVEDLYQTQLTTDGARIHLQSKIPELQAWAKVFIKSKNEGLGTVKDRNGQVVQMSVNKLLDVEEHVWSPMYGLKGNIDATIQVTMETTTGSGAHTLTVPLELKTGKRENASHRAQTALYTLLLSDRYDVAVAYGILYYIETSQTLRIPAIRHELRGMVMQRNELACYVRERLELPPMVRNKNMCTSCYAKEPCFLYHRLVEDGDGETSGLRDKFEALTKQLAPVHQTFFKKWNALITKEESEMMKFKRELWTMLSHEREKLGRCFANVSLIPESAREDAATAKINRYTYSFKKQGDLVDYSFSESQIAVGDPIVVSDEQGHYALAKGYVTATTKSRLEVAVDRRLHNARTRLPGFDAENNQVFAGITDNYSRTGTQQVLSQASNADRTPCKPMLYRVDKDEFSNGMALVRANLVSIMSNSAFNASKLRSLVVDGVPPTFKTHSTAYALSGPASQANINGDQRAAIEKILSAEDYALVLGMPGTGKTTTIAHIIRALVAKGKSVLLTSYTHSAVDNILLKLRGDKVPILRLGALAKVHPDVKEFAMLAVEPRSTIEELEKLYTEPQVVATTCLGINHAIFQQRTFDYCIVDEASQLTLPVCLGPIRLARSFVLVGDHYQLPPLVQNTEAREGGLDVSLFRTLCENHPEAVTELGVQYRMNAEIMSLSNTLIYDGKLKCGSDAVANRRLLLPRWSNIESSFSQGTASSSLLHQCLAPQTSPLIFLNTDTLAPHHHETAHGARITNTLEVSLTVALIRALLLCGVPASSIGIITLYRSQLALIKSILLSDLGPLARDVEAHTADRFQGRDKEVVVISCVRSNERGVVGELLRDWRRVNVAVTRARSKVLIVGSRGTLGGNGLLQKMIGLFETNGKVVDVEEGWEMPLPELGALMFESPARPSASATTGTGSASAAIRPAGPEPRIADPAGQPHEAVPANNSSTSPRKPLVPLSSSATNTTANSQRPRSSGVKPPLHTTHKPFKVPSKVGKGALTVKKGPILEDVLNDILGDGDGF